jgi:hypothetical protein
MKSHSSYSADKSSIQHAPYVTSPPIIQSLFVNYYKISLIIVEYIKSPSGNCSITQSSYLFFSFFNYSILHIDL